MKTDTQRAFPGVTVQEMQIDRDPRAFLVLAAVNQTKYLPPDVMGLKELMSLIEDGSMNVEVLLR